MMREHDKRQKDRHGRAFSRRTTDYVEMYSLAKKMKIYFIYTYEGLKATI